MLSALRQVLRPHGRIALFTIEFRPGISREQRQRWGTFAPRATAARAPYPELLASAGFVGIQTRDVTAQYEATCRAWAAAAEPRFAELAADNGEDEMTERITGWKYNAKAVQAGVLSRHLYWATRP